MAQDIADKLRRGDGDNSVKPRSPSPTSKQTSWSFMGMLSGAAGLVIKGKGEGQYLRELTRVQRFRCVDFIV